MRDGSLAQALVNDHGQNGGLVTVDDLAAYAVEIGEPYRVQYRDYEVLLPQQCSVGGVLIGFTLKLLNAFDSAEILHSPHAYQLFFEVMEATSRARHHAESNPDIPTIRILED